MKKLLIFLLATVVLPVMALSRLRVFKNSTSETVTVSYIGESCFQFPGRKKRCTEKQIKTNLAQGKRTYPISWSGNLSVATSKGSLSLTEDEHEENHGLKLKRESPNSVLTEIIEQSK